jgi:hypothetical protein
MDLIIASISILQSVAIPEIYAGNMAQFATTIFSKAAKSASDSALRRF